MHESTSLFFEQLREGDSWKSPSRIVTAEDVADFADLTGDQDRLHVDPDFAATTPFGRPIAHGLLGLSFMAGLSSLFPAVRTTAFVGIQDWQFLKPVYIGDSIHVVTKIVDLQEHGRNHGMVRWFRQVINQAGQVVQQGSLTTIVARASAIRRTDAASKVGTELRSHLNVSSVEAATSVDSPLI